MQLQRPTPLPEPDADARAHSDRLAALLHDEVAAADGLLPFDLFMERVLYAPGLGYYSAGARRFGSCGDFVTAPEISALFGQCLATPAAAVLAALDGGSILEIGAGSGTLAADLLLTLEAAGMLPERYLVLELSGTLRAEQQATLARRAAHLADRVVWLDSPPEPGFRGLVLGNEVADALPVSRFRLAGGSVEEACVTSDGTSFAWAWRPAAAPLAVAVEALLADVDALPDGYVSEICTRLGPWFGDIATRLAQGAVLLIDYGYPRREYYHPQRTEGTLLCHYRHRVHPDPLRLVGLQDITAHVDFTALAEAGTAGGLALAGYTTQAHFLIGCGLERHLARSDPDDGAAHLALVREVKTLTLPGEMGERFQAIGFTRDLPVALPGFDVRDLRGRL